MKLSTESSRVEYFKYGQEAATTAHKMETLWKELRILETRVEPFSS